MQLSKENRTSPRHRQSAAVRYAFRDSDRFFSGTMQNYSREGMGIEVGYAISPGSDITIIVEPDPHQTIQLDARRKFPAKVKWCRSQANTRAFFYSVGVKFAQ